MHFISQFVFFRTVNALHDVSFVIAARICSGSACLLPFSKADLYASSNILFVAVVKKR